MDKRPLDNDDSDNGNVEESGHYRLTGKRTRTEEEVNNERTVFISNVAFKADEDEILAFLNANIGDCESVVLSRNKDGASKGIGKVVFASVEATQKALSKDRIMFAKRPIFISPYTPHPEGTRRRIIKKKRDPRVLFVSHLPSGATKEELMGIFDGADSIRLVESKHIAYVEYIDEQRARAGLSNDRQIIRDTPIRVQISDPQLGNARVQRLQFTPRSIAFHNHEK